jgi:Outer membrane protein beta-barrel domain
MKKIILFMLTAMLTTVAMAQTKNWKIALHVDPNLSWVKPDNKNINAGENKLNFGFGVAIDKMFTDNYAVGTGFNIINLGGRLSYFDERITEDGQRTIALMDRTYKLQYAEIPLTLKLRTNEIGYITYWAQVGVGLGFNIKAKSDDIIDYKKLENGTNPDSLRWTDATTIIDESIEDEDIGDDIGIFRTSLIVAGGIEYNLSGDASIVAGLCFNNAFSDILKGQGVADSNNEPDFNLLDNTPKEFDLKGISNCVSLQIGILF